MLVRAKILMCLQGIGSKECAQGKRSDLRENDIKLCGTRKATDGRAGCTATKNPGCVEREQMMKVSATISAFIVVRVEAQYL